MKHVVQRRLPRGAFVGPYEVQGLLGEGGMGTVYLCRHARSKQRFAVKVLHPGLADDQDIVQRFFAEAGAVNHVDHENVIEIHDFVADGTSNYYVMEYLLGESLEDLYLRKRSLRVSRAIRIFVQIAAAMEAVHAAGIIHRDLKPANIFICDPMNGYETVKILDFGVARAGKAVRQHQHFKTAKGQLFGSPGYVAPEYAMRGTLTNRADIYALGVIMFELLTGKRLFEGDSCRGLITQHIEDEPSCPREMSPLDVPQELSNLVLKCLRKSPRDRPKSMKDIVLKLERIAENLGIALDPPQLNPGYFGRGAKAAALVLGLAGAAALGAAYMHRGGSNTAVEHRTSPSPTALHQNALINPFGSSQTSDD